MDNLNENNIIVGDDFERSIYSTVGELLMLVLKMHNDKVLQIDATTGEKLTSNMLVSKAILLAKWFRNNNINPGDCISISSENCLDFCVVSTAAFFSGITLAPLNPEYTTGEQKHVLNLSKPKAIFCSSQTIQQLLTSKSQFPYIKHFLLIGSKNKRNGVILLEDIVKDADVDISSTDEFEVTPLNPDEAVAIILCSSGTTGLPKGVMTTHYNITAYIEIISQVLKEYMTGDVQNQVMTGLAPFFHGMGFMLMTLNMLGGNTVVLYSKFDSKLFLESISKYQVTSIVVPPPVLVFLVKHPMVKNYDLSSVRDIRSGAAPMGKELENKIREQFKIKQVSQNYGMTETTLGVLMTRVNMCRLGSVGRIVPGMKCKVIDENGETLGPNRKGELCFKGPLIMKGYVNDPESTANTIDKNNWLRTGDVGYYDDDGFFYIVDRIKELIKYKGFQVAPAELEAVLLTHPAVADAAVVGINDERAGELPLAFVVKKPTNNVTSTELEKYVAERVSSAKKLRGGVYFVQSIPRNQSGKILRRELREKAKRFKSKL